MYIRVELERGFPDLMQFSVEKRKVDQVVQEVATSAGIHVHVRTTTRRTLDQAWTTQEQCDKITTARRICQCEQPAVGDLAICEDCHRLRPHQRAVALHNNMCDATNDGNSRFMGPHSLS